MDYVEIDKDLLTLETLKEDEILETVSEGAAELELSDPESSNDEEVDEPVSKLTLSTLWESFSLQRYVVPNVSDKETSAALLNSASMLQKDLLKAIEVKKNYFLLPNYQYAIE
jgi:hypothetical protein